RAVVRPACSRSPGQVPTSAHARNGAAYGAGSPDRRREGAPAPAHAGRVDPGSRVYAGESLLGSPAREAPLPGAEGRGIGRASPRHVCPRAGGARACVAPARTAGAVGNLLRGG